MRQLMLSALAAIGAVGPIVAGGSHGVALVLACLVVAVAAGSLAYAAQQDQKGGCLFPIKLNIFNKPVLRIRFNLPRRETRLPARLWRPGEAGVRDAGRAGQPGA
jgi:hypothetical protein